MAVTGRAAWKVGLRAGAVVGGALSLLVAAASADLQNICLLAMAAQRTQPAQAPSVRSADSLTSSFKDRIADARRKLDALAPQGAYLIVSTAENMFYLMSGMTLIRKGNCSTGSYVLLKTPDNKRKWLFETPRGAHRVLEKTEDPVWHKPDWAFVEEGKPIPPAGSPERDEYGVLGAYSLALGQGYMIHGTLYQRFLGMPVTHGCVRLGDDDLKAVYANLSVGSKVFIY